MQPTRAPKSPGFSHPHPRSRATVPGTTSSLGWGHQQAGWALRPVYPQTPTLAPHLSSRLMSTPTEGGAARMSVIRGRKRCRISFSEVQPVCT